MSGAYCRPLLAPVAGRTCDGGVVLIRVFDGRKAAEDYMSAHTLAFSTPDLTLKRFAFWLGDMVPDPSGAEGTVPRIDTFVEEKDFEPMPVVDDDSYTPSGAVLGSMYGDPSQGAQGSRFCAECGSGVSQGAKFCVKCGTAAP